MDPGEPRLRGSGQVVVLSIMIIGCRMGRMGRMGRIGLGVFRLEGPGCCLIRATTYSGTLDHRQDAERSLMVDRVNPLMCNNLYVEGVVTIH
eukprot:2573087-Pyramimonas_sp.AAC.1